MLSIIALISVAVTGCSSSAPAETKGGTLLLLSSSKAVMHLDPQRIGNRADQGFASSLLHRTLVAYSMTPDAPSTLEPDLATDLGTPSKDARSWQFTLREGLKFEDGSPITCASVKYGVSRAFATKSLQGGTTYAQQLLDIPRGKDGISPVYKGPYVTKGNKPAAFDAAVSCSSDDRTITFKLNQPFADFNHVVTLTAFAPVSQAADEAGEYDRKPLASGPYRVDWNEPGQRIVLTRNKKWNPETDPLRAAVPDKIEVKFGIDLAKGIEDLRSDNVLTANAILLDRIPTDQLSVVFNDPVLEGRRLNDFDTSTTFAAINVKSVPCLYIRQAVAAAVDRKALLTAQGGADFAGDLADGLLKPSLLGADFGSATTSASPVAGDPAAAQALLTQAKAKCKPAFKKLVKQGLVLNLPDTGSSAQSAEIWRKSLSAAGIKLRIELVAPNRYYSTLRNPKLMGDIATVGWSPDWLAASAVLPALVGDGRFAFNLTRNAADPTFEQFVAKLNEVKATTDVEGQVRLWGELNRYAVDRGWVVPGLFTRMQLIWGAHVQGVSLWTPYGCPNYNNVSVVGS